MGIWGPAIMSNDIASDLRDEWKELLGDGVSPEKVSSLMIQAAIDDGTFDNFEEEYCFWLSFALIQWKTGRLQPKVKQKALELLKAKEYVAYEKELWPGKADFKKRMGHLEKLLKTLESDQPKAKKIPKPYRQTTILEAGDICTILLDSGFYVAFQIIGVEGSRSEAPVAVLFNYLSKVKPSSSILANLEIIKFESLSFFNGHSNFSFGAIKRSQNEPKERIQILEKRSPLKTKPHMPQSLSFWDEIDFLLERWILDFREREKKLPEN